MASFSFEAPTPTEGLPADCALRIRVRRSAIGSVMLIVRASPTRLRQARDFAAIGGIARLALQFRLRRFARFRSGLRVADQLFELSASSSVFLRYLEAFLLAHEHIRLGHELLPYLRNGKLKASNNARPCLSSCADVEMVMSIPRIWSIWSYWISGKIICSLTPRL